MLPGEIPTVAVSDVHPDAVVLDVREREEWTAGHIEGARHVPMFQVPQHVSLAEDLTTDVPIVVVCKMGGRSAQVTAWLNQHGYEAMNLDGGMLAWASAGRPMISEDGAAPRVA
jgi:rhodanese-related sulfurtransferase